MPIQSNAMELSTKAAAASTAAAAANQKIRCNFHTRNYCHFVTCSSAISMCMENHSLETAQQSNQLQLIKHEIIQFKLLFPGAKMIHHEWPYFLFYTFTCQTYHFIKMCIHFDINLYCSQKILTTFWHIFAGLNNFEMNFFVRTQKK